MQFFQSFTLILGEVVLGRFENLQCLVYFGTNCVSPFFFKIHYCLFYSSYDIFVRQCFFFKVIEKLRHFERRSVLILVSCLENILITHFFSTAVLVALCVTLFLLINSLNFCIFLFFVKSKDFLTKSIQRYPRGRDQNEHKFTIR